MTSSTTLLIVGGSIDSSKGAGVERVVVLLGVVPPHVGHEAEVMDFAQEVSLFEAPLGALLGVADAS